MKKLKIGLLFSALIFFGLGLSSCNNAKSSDKDMTEEAATEASETDMSGPEYTSAYICPMHCKGSGSAEPGKCPACGMDYVSNESMKATEESESEGTMEGEMEGGEGEMDGHEGHNH